MDFDIRNNGRATSNGKASDIEGFAVWHLNYKPDFPMDFGMLLGYKV